MGDVWMNEARALVHGVEKTVQLSGHALLSPLHEIYDEAVHGKALSCRHCNARVHFNRGSGARCGSNFPGARPHFKTNPGHAHDENCKWPQRELAAHSTHNYDPGKGWRIHLNFGNPANVPVSPFYVQHDDHRIEARDADLKDRAPYAVNTAEDVVSLIKQGDFQRLMGSRVIYEHYNLGWEQFFIRADKREGYSRFSNLVSALQNGQKRPVLMEFNAASRGAKGQLVGHALTLPGGDRLTVQIWPDGNGLKDTFAAASAAQFVMGEARLRSFAEGNHRHHFINISVKSSGQITAVSAKQLAAQARL